MGMSGRGTAEYFDCLGKVDIITGTCSKSFGCVGGFVAASKKIIQYLRYYADSNVFSAAMTPQVAGSVLKAIEIIKNEPQVRQQLWSNVNYLREKLKERQFDIGKSVTPIFPVMVRDNLKVYQVAEELRKREIFASGIVYPAVRTKEARIRISILATHEKWQLDHLVNSLTEIRNIVSF
jgi:glycine C-acetyltransferase